MEFLIEFWNTLKHRLIEFLLAVFFLWFSELPALAQNKQLDSLKKVTNIKKVQKLDTSLIYNLVEIAILYNDTNLDSSDVYLDLASNFLEKYPWQKGSGLNYSARGHYYFRAGLYDKALKEYYKAQTIFTKIEDNFNIASIKLHIGSLHTYLKQYDLSKPYLFEALNICKKFKNKSLYAVCLGNIGNFYIKTGDFQNAVYYLKNCLEILESGKTDKLKEQSRIVAGNNLLAVAYINAGKPDSSKICEKKCEKLGIEIKNFHNLFDMYLGLSEYHNKVKINKLALDYSKKALKQAQNLNSIEKISACYFQIYRINKKLGNENLALYNLENYNILEDSIQKNNSAKQIAILINKEESDQQKSKIQELTIQNLSQSKDFIFKILLISLVSILFFIWQSKKLKLKNRDLELKNKEISEAMLKGQTLERKRVAVDLHDNLGNTLSSIQWSLKAFDKNKMDIEEREVYENLTIMLKDAYNQVRLLSHNMLPEEFEKHGLIPAIKYLINKLNQNTSIDFQFEVENYVGRLDNKIEFELYSICHELVNNIIKHSTANKAVIKLKLNETSISLLISENGNGFSDRNYEGIGLKNIQARVDSLKGKWIKEINNENYFSNEIIVKLS
jgi:two-component system, NarL family, sensor kinase